MSNYFGPGGSSAGSGVGVATVVSLAEDQQCNGYGITELRDPTNPQDAATKAYVDSHGGGGGGVGSLNQVLTLGNNAFNQNIQNVGELSLATLSSSASSAPFQISVGDNLDLGGSYKITNLANATSSGDAVNLNTLTTQLGGYVQSTATGSIQMGGFNITNAAIVASSKFKAADGINQSQIWFTGGAGSNSLLKIGPADQTSYAIECDTDSGQTDIVQVNTDTLSNITGNPVDVVGGIKIDAIYDKNNSSGSSGNVLTAGAGGELVWQSGGASGGIDGIVAGDGILVNANNPSLPIVSTSAVKIITAGSGISLSGDNNNLTISASAGSGLTSVSSNNLGLSVGTVTNNTQTLTSNYIGVALFQYDSLSPAGSYINPGQTLSINFTPINAQANSILKTFSGNVALYFSYTMSVYFDGFVDFNPADIISASISTSAQGSANGSDNNRATNNFDDQTSSLSFNIVCESNTFTNSSNATMSLRVTNSCATASFMPIFLPNVIRCDIFELGNFTPAA